MAIPQVAITNSFNEWRIMSNTVANTVGDLSSLYNSLPSIVSSLNDLQTRKYEIVGGPITGNVAIAGILTVAGSSQFAGVTTGNLTVGASLFSVASSSGNTLISGTLGVSGTTTLGTANISSLAVTNAATVGSTLNVVGNFSVNTSSFTVAATTGNTAVGGTLTVTNNVIASTAPTIGTHLTNKTFTDATYVPIAHATDYTLHLTSLENTWIDTVSAAVTSAQVGYLSTATSDIQVQINTKQATITGAATSILSTNLGTSLVLVSDGSGKVAASAITSTTLGYLDATSSIQTQLNLGLTSAAVVPLGNILYGNASRTPLSIAPGGASGASTVVLLGTNTTNNGPAYYSLSSSSSVSVSMSGGVLTLATTGSIGGTNFTGDLTVGSPTKATIAAANGNITTSGALSVSGASTLGTISGTGLAITGAATVSTTLGVTGLTSLTSLAVSTNLTIGSSTFTVVASSGNTLITGTLGVSGTTTLGLANISTVAASTTITTPTIAVSGNSSAQSYTLNTNTVLTNSTLITSAITPAVIMSIPIATYRSGEILIQGVDSVSSKYQVVKMLAIHNGTVAYSTEYGSIDNSNGANVTATYSVAISGGNLQITATPVTSNTTTFKVTGILTLI